MSGVQVTRPGTADGTTAGASTAPGRGPTRWERWRTGVLCAVLVLLIALLTALLAPRTGRDALAPDSVAPDGARAVARVLAAQGVDVVPARSFAAARDALADAGADATLLITAPELVSAGRWPALTASGADLVLLSPRTGTLAEIAPQVVTSGTTPADVVDPGCSAAVPTAAGAARAGGRQYALQDGSAQGGGGGGTTCYAGSWVQLPPQPGRDGTLTLLGQDDVLTNRWAAADGNAALALGTLGAHRTLVWYLPDPLDADASAQPLSALVPPWVLPAGALLLASGLVAALWRGRRLGRLVPEPLPVVVRAVETVEGHGRLYATAGATGRAAEALRAATLRRLRGQVRLEPSAGVDDVAGAVAWVTGRAAADVRTLLADDAPRDDPALVRLAGDLDELERDVRRHST